MSSENWTRVDEIDSFTDGSPRNIAGVTVFLLDNKWYVTETRCPHMGYPMSKGTIRDGVVTCAWHKWDFDLGHGACYRGACDDLKIYPHKIQDGVLYIQKQADKAADDSWKRLLPEAMMQGDRFLLAKIIHRALDQGVQTQELVAVAHQQAFQHAIRAHQNMQAVREMHAISICSAMAKLLSSKQQTHALLHGLGMASGPAGIRPAVIPLPAQVTSDDIIARLNFYCQESSSLGIERLLLSADWKDSQIDLSLLACASSTAFLHASETFIGVSICLDLKNQATAQEILAANLSWILGAPRNQAPADAIDAAQWLQHKDQAVASDQAPPCTSEILEQRLAGNQVAKVFELCHAWLSADTPFERILDVASVLCARRLARLSLNNGGLWRDASRGLRLCAAMRNMHRQYPDADTTSWAYLLFYFLFESRWLQTSSPQNPEIDPSTADWDACQDAYEHLALRECREQCLRYYAADPSKAQANITGLLLQDDLDYELLASMDVIFSEMVGKKEWPAYLSGLITYAIDQRNRRGSLAAAQFGNSFNNGPKIDQ